jgi:hypothetical protein
MSKGYAGNGVANNGYAAHHKRQPNVIGSSSRSLKGVSYAFAREGASSRQSSLTPSDEASGVRFDVSPLRARERWGQQQGSLSTARCGIGG